MKQSLFAICFHSSKAAVVYSGVYCMEMTGRIYGYGPRCPIKGLAKLRDTTLATLHYTTPSGRAHATSTDEWPLSRRIQRQASETARLNPYSRGSIPKPVAARQGWDIASCVTMLRVRSKRALKDGILAARHTFSLSRGLTNNQMNFFIRPGCNQASEPFPSAGDRESGRPGREGLEAIGRMVLLWISPLASSASSPFLTWDP
ncbi:uncharacterized protein LY79DRAFT_176925 [Colletotrichum navitas]|uniref:Uncharacterized protein n=1 Tax=Colletotrichum navitas TaxID=681940 RepID=A0AAD8Q0Q9_9PEZI|nr:uncharacterized protein LY79DRAFT_176925 [Colletotrichum navitas]KAK1593670.1 hypothetical protein LY79DRAFT_176925 [Colletotrichum navitas]